MADPRFFTKSKDSFTLAEVAKIVGGRLADGVDPTQIITDFQPLEGAGASDISFFDNPKYRAQFKASKAGACLVNEKDVADAPAGMSLIVCPSSYVAYAKFAATLYPDPADLWVFPTGGAIHPSAKIDPSAHVSEGAYIGENVEIGAGTVVAPTAVLHKGVKIGQNGQVGAGAVIECALIGDNVMIHAGAKIGQRGFGFAPTPEGPLKIPQLGRVVIENKVEVGANTTIDRGAGPDTVIGEGTMIDNLVQIGHNTKIGKNCILVAQVGISGSSELGNFVVMGGQAATSGHLKIGDGTQIAARGGVTKDVASGQTMAGFPLVPIKDWQKQSVVLKRLAKKGAGGSSDS